MDNSTTVKPRRQISLIASLAIVVIILSGLFVGAVPIVLAVVGIALAVVAWGYALLVSMRAKQGDWTLLLGIGLAIALALAAYAYIKVPTGDKSGLTGATQLGFVPLAFFASAFAALGVGKAIDRGLAAFFGGWGVLILVIGGTLVGGAIGTTIGAAAGNISELGFRLYGVAGVLGLIAWIDGLIVGFRTKSWGWFALVVLLPGIGAFMFGLFGPTRQDVVMAQENSRQRRAVGLS